MNSHRSGFPTGTQPDMDFPAGQRTPHPRAGVAARGVWGLPRHASGAIKRLIAGHPRYDLSPASAQDIHPSPAMQTGPFGLAAARLSHWSTS